MADKLGQPFMPWQRLAADVGGEINPLTGLPAYREVRVTVPRQSGKTTLFLSWQINRCVSRRWRHPQRSAFTAQTGKDARDKWIDELFPLIRNSRLKELVSSKGSRLEINEGMGNECIRFKTGSLIRLLSTATTSGHSKTLHQAVMDEVWHDTDDRREQGLRPAMITVPDAQLLVCSTAGTQTSTVLNRKVETGREAVEADLGTGVAYFEWSAPDDWDPLDEQSYFTFMPALCPDPPCRCAGPGETWRHTITSLDAIRAERDEMEPAEFKRAYGNVPTGLTDEVWQVISKADWERGDDPNSQAKDPVVFAMYTTWERTHTSIAAVGERADGNLHAVIVEHRPHGDWPISRMVELAQKWKPAAIVLDPSGATNSMLEPLNRALKKVEATDPAGNQLEVTTLTAREAAAGWGIVYDALSSKPRELAQGEQRFDRRLFWRSDLNAEVLTTSVRRGQRRNLGEGHAWECKTDVDMSPIKAVTDAVYGFVTRPADVVEPWVMYE